jgi:hypothetical protein
MKAQTRLETAKPQVTGLMAPITPNPLPPPATGRAPAASKAARLDPRAKPDASAQFRADLLRRSEAPFTPAGSDGGLND